MPSTSHITEIQHLIESADSILVTSHMDGDGDSIGTQLAVLDYLAWLGKKAVAAHQSTLPSALMFLHDSSRLHDVRNESELMAVEKLAPFDLMIVLECPNPDRMGAVWKLKSDTTKIINIDHHSDNTNYGDALWVDSQASSVGELMAHYFDAVSFPYGKTTAEALYSAILTDTGRFHYNSASSGTFAIVAELLKRDIDIRNVTDTIFFQRSPSSLKLLGSALSSIRFFAEGRVAIIELTANDFKAAGASANECEGIVEYTLMATGVDVGALVRSFDGKRTKVSLRSRGKYDVAAIAALFGGGGHAGAAGCVFDSVPSVVAETIGAKLIAVLESEVQAGVAT